jgi:tRNA (cmo5U34)-methyltransferase
VSSWTEDDSARYRDIAPAAVPRADEMFATMIALVPFSPQAPLRIVELGSGEGRLASALLECFPRATMLALDGSDSMRAEATRRLVRFSDRARVAAFELTSLDWWDLLRRADVVMSSLALHHLNDAKKQYVYKAIADRISERGALIVADLILPTHPAGRTLAADIWDASARQQADEAGSPARFDRFVSSKWNYHRFPDASDQPSAIFHHLVWLKHAGFAAVDCWWSFAGHAVFGGCRSLDAPETGIPYAEALTAARKALER